MLSLVGGTTAAGSSASASTLPCTKADVEVLAHRFFDVARLHFTHPPATPWLNRWADHIWVDCQFRLYDDNDDPSSPDSPEVPHVFSTRDYVLGGIVIFETREAPFEFIPGPEFDRAGAIAGMKTWTDRVFWGPASVGDDALEEIPVTVGPYQDGVSPFGAAVGNQRYFIFPPGSLAPGEYKWRYEQHAPPYPDESVRGSVVITR
jgi:hypothetical protein